MTQAIMQNANYTYNTQTGYGTIVVNLITSTNAGYVNQCIQYNDYGHISVPLPKQIINIERQADSQVIVTGYENSVTDQNLSINPGESINFSTNWYHARANAGIYMQPANTANKENSVMGQSTNKVIADILNRLIALETWANNHMHNPGSFQVILPGTLNAGGPTPVMVTGVSANPASTSPDGNNINDDLTYINGNKNLAITGVYTPYEP